MKRILHLASVVLLILIVGLPPRLIAQQALRTGGSYLPLGHCQFVDPNAKKGTGWLIGTFGDTPVGVWARASRSMLAPYKGCKVVGLRIGMAGDLKKANVSLLNNTIKREILMTKTSALAFGWNEVRFDQPMAITGQLNELVYGFQFVEKDIVNPKQPFIIACDRNLKAPRDAFYVNKNNASFDSRTEHSGALLVQLMIEGPTEKINNRASVSSPRENKVFDASGKLGVTYMVRNDGANDIDQLEVSYSIDGAVVYKDLQKKTIKRLKTRQLKTKGIPVTNGQTLTARITKINDRVTDLPGFELNIQDIADKAFDHKVLLEQFTTEGCGSCPGGHRYLKKLLTEDDYADRFVWVAHHIGYGRDTFSLPESEALLFFYDEQSDDGSYVETAPVMLLDRTHTELYHYWEKYQRTTLPIISGEDAFNHELFDEALSRPAFISVNIQESCDPNTRTLALTISGESYREHLDADNLYLNLYLVEDDIYSRRQKGVGKADDDKLKPYYHHGVIRQVPLGANGYKITLDDKGQYSYKTSLQIPKEWSAANMRIVAFVAKSLAGGSRNAMVLNSNETKIAAYESITPTPEQEETVQLYTRDGRIYTSRQDATITMLYNMSGQQVCNEALAQGVYIAVIQTSFGSYMRKVIVL